MMGKIWQFVLLLVSRQWLSLNLRQTIYSLLSAETAKGRGAFQIRIGSPMFIAYLSDG
jgi:hypothetical protein